jgi:hypothetical protein
MYYDKLGKLITFLEWSNYRNNIEYWVVKKTKIGYVDVSTVWLGSNPPLIFETMILGGKNAGHCVKYATEYEALDGHEKIVNLLKQNLELEHIDDKILFLDRELVILESPFSGDVNKNIEYARQCIRDSIVNHYENPYASHLLFTQPGILDDTKEDERNLGISLGFDWGKYAKKTVVYCDLGISRGMELGITEAKKQNRVIEYRKLF